MPLTLVAATACALASTVGLVPTAVPLRAGQVAAREAGELLQDSGLKAGLVVHVGCGDGRLTAALGENPRMLVQGLDRDPRNVEAARRYLRSLGRYGRVSVDRWEGQRLPYADNLVNVLVVEQPEAVPRSEIFRVLVPRGVAYVRKGSQWKKLVKPWPDELDEWTHYLHGPDNNAVSRDRLVGPPARVQWLDSPRWQRHHEFNANPNAMVSANGRLFYIIDEAPATVAGLPDRWRLVARDAFNGLVLWKRPVPDWGWKAWSAVETGGRFNLPLHIPRRLVAAGDRVYVTLGFNAPLSVLDAATGKTLKVYEGTQYTDEILFYKGLLVLTVNTGPQPPDSAGAVEMQRRKRRRQIVGKKIPPVPKRLVVLDADSGQIKWTREGFTGVPSSPIAGHIFYITRLLTAAGQGMVVCLDRDALLAFDLETGRQLWRTQRPPVPANPKSHRENLINFATLVIADDMVLLLQTEESYDLRFGTGKRGVHCRLYGFEAKTGKLRWSLPCSKWGPASEGDLFVVGGLAWTHHATDFALIGVDIHTGQVRRTIPTKVAFDEVHHHRCYRNKATERYVLTGRRGIETIDLQSGAITKNEWVRGACRYGIMPANGLIYVPPHPCQCYIDVKLSGFFALAAAKREQRNEESARMGPRWIRGPAYEAVATAGAPERPAAAASSFPSELDWSTYRHDPRRSGATDEPLPGPLSRLWSAPVGASATACTVADDRLFVAVPEEHRVVALDARDGHLLWEFIAGGRVDTPPTIDGPRVLFGCADGWVYCLRASDGALAWRFRAAPEERRIIANGQLESAWPVHGTVLVTNGVAYVAAGRSTHLDGGIFVYALQSATGRLLKQFQPVGPRTEGLEDVLVAAGHRVFMRHLEYRLNAETTSAEPIGPRAYATCGLLDDSYFARVGWATRVDLGKNRKSKLGRLGKLAHLLVFDRQTSYEFRTVRHGGFGGWFELGAQAGELAAVDYRTGKRRWQKRLPLLVRAMAVAGSTLVVAGVPQTAPADDPWAVVEGRDGGLLVLFDKGTGQKLAEYRLDAAPRWDGLAVAAGKLFLSTRDGRVICFRAQK